MNVHFDNVRQDEIVWRYMRLETLLLLLHRSAVFLPTLSKLTADEPNEGQLPRRALPTEAEVEQLEAISCWLEAKANSPELLKGLVGNQRVLVLREIWLRELSKRRLVWCWQSATAESMAQWQIFAQRGVAIRSTASAVAGALYHAVESPILVLKARYCEPPAGENLLSRPFSWKRDSFIHESEVRFVLRCQAIERGLCLSVIPTDFIDDIVVSPFCLLDEACAVTDALTHYFRGKSKTPRIYQSSQRTAPTKALLFKELLKEPNGSAVRDAEDGIPELLRLL